MIQSDPDTPEVHRGAECLPHGFPEDGALVHVRVEVLLRPVQRHELLIVLQLPRSAEVSELVDNTAVILDELHDVAGLEVAVDEVVVAEVVHAGAEVGEHQQELVLVQPVAVLGVVQEVEQAAARAQLHHDHLGRWCRLFICEVLSTTTTTIIRTRPTSIFVTPQPNPKLNQNFTLYNQGNKRFYTFFFEVKLI